LGITDSALIAAINKASKEVLYHEQNLHKLIAEALVASISTAQDPDERMI